MSNIVLISPFSQKLRNHQQNPKNFPHWQKLISMLRQNSDIDEVWQIGVGNEYRFEATTNRFFDQPLPKIAELAKQSSVWLSVENFMPHLCNALGVPTTGIVLYSKSDPKHYGYANNINLLKDPKYLRSDQFHIWEQCDYSEEAFVTAEVVYEEIIKVLQI